MDKENKIIIILILVICFLIGSLNKSTSYFFNNETRNTVIKETSDPMEDYLIGVIACEMPASFHEEALKAQAVSARTYLYNELSKDLNKQLTDDDPYLEMKRKLFDVSLSYFKKSLNFLKIN